MEQDDLRVLHTGEGRVLVGLTKPEIEQILETLTEDPFRCLGLRQRLLTALSLIDRSAAMEKFRSGG